ncbi:hypothetical protein [Ehrlichia ruminantium]|nr:hypothetical protein [Ehrlichia ruminantium]
MSTYYKKKNAANNTLAYKTIKIEQEITEQFLYLCVNRPTYNLKYLLDSK